MTRTNLLGAASAAALACLSTASHAATQAPITGGGSTLAQFDYIAEISVFNAVKKSLATFSTYWEAGSGTGQEAFIYDDLTCDIDKVTGANGGACAGPAGGAGNTVDYGASDATLSSTQISTWATSSFGQSAAGNLIQLPSMGVGISIPVNNPAITANGVLEVSDNDLCGIFSGLLTDFSQITDSGTTPTPGPFNVVYRTDSSGTSFLLTGHLSAVCIANNSSPTVTFTATTTFATLFPNNGAGVINTSAFPNAIGEKGSSGVADELAGCNGAVPDAFGYLSPDFTTVDPQSDATLGCEINGSEKSPLVVAGVFNGKKSYIPTVTEIKLGLLHPKAGTGQNLTPPANAIEGANPALWVPVEPLVTEGYPIVGYTTFDFAQCYASTAVASAIDTFLLDHYKKASYKSIETNNGFVDLKASHASQFFTTIADNILANKKGWNTDIEDATACSGLAGR
jgi:ABC-type phosphate transport system substrate-binding protein